MWRSGLRLGRVCARLPLCRPVWSLTLPPPALQHLHRGQLEVWRGYSNKSPGHSRVKVVGIPNPFIWLRTRAYVLFIQSFLDRDFSMEEFIEGAKQAFSFVSGILSQCKFDALETLVDSEILKDLKNKCSALSDSYRKALSVDSNEILYSFPGDVSIYYDNVAGKWFVSILMRFWYLKYTDLPDDKLEGTKVFQVLIGNQDEKEKDAQRLLTANYVFCREFTQGVKPDWIITRIEHSKLLE